MVTFGTPFASATFSRVSTTLTSNVILSNLRRNQEDLFRIQEQLSTGYQIIRPSDDPIGANRVQDFTQRISQGEQFVRNIDTAQGRLTMSDASLSEANEIANRARELLLSQAQSTATAQTRLVAAQEVTQLLQEAVNLANIRYEDRYLYGGSRTGSAPFALLGSDVVFRGDLSEFRADVADGLRVSTNVTAGVFGALSSDLRGLDPATLQPVDLDPQVTVSTRLADLNGGRGVGSGSIQVTGSGTATIDFRVARTVGDVVDLINARTGDTGVSASVIPGGLQLTSASPITVQEVAGGRTAADLGILGTAVTSPLNGTDLDPLITKDTLVGDLFGGAGLDPAGIVVTNASSSQTLTVTFGADVFAASRSIEQMLSAINASNAQVEARLNEAGTGIDLFSRLSGARLTVSENGGATAAQLGLLSTLGRARLEDLNGGAGVGSIDGPDIRITKMDGTQILLDVDGAASVQGLVDALDADPDLSAAIVGSSIVITDTSAANGTLTIENVNGSYAATNLGIAGTVTGAGPQVISGSALTCAGVQVEGIFTALIRLRDALNANDTAAINAAAGRIDAAQNKILDARTGLGAKINSLDLTKNRLSQEKLELEKLRSSTRDADLAEAASRFQLQMTVLQASLATAARIMETNIFNYL